MRPQKVELAISRFKSKATVLFIDQVGYVKKHSIERILLAESIPNGKVNGDDVKTKINIKFNDGSHALIYFDSDEKRDAFAAKIAELCFKEIVKV